MKTMRSHKYFSPPPVSVSEYRHIFQQGSGIPWGNSPVVYRGRRAQRGFGIFGNVFSFIKKVAAPVARRLLPVAKSIGQKALNEAVELGKEVVFEGKSPAASLKKRSKRLLKRVWEEDLNQQKGSGNLLDEPWKSPARKRARRTRPIKDLMLLPRI
jgi:hypothetical protein